MGDIVGTPENGESDPAESETKTEDETQKEDSESNNETPVIDEGDSSEENPSEENPAVEETPIERDTVEEPETSDTEGDSSITVEANEDAAKPAKPVITVKSGGSDAANMPLPNRATGVTFEIGAAEDVTFKYTINGEDPTKDTETTYSVPVEIEAPDKDTEEEVTIKAIAVVTPEGGEAQVSDVETVKVVFAAKAAETAGKTISLSNESEETEVGSVYIIKDDGSEELTEIPLDKTSSCTITDPQQRVYVEVVVANDSTLFEVMYRSKDKDDVWTSASQEKVEYERDTYRIPDDRLEENLEIKVVRMRTITLNWTGDASWGNVEMSASALRAESNYNGNLIIWGDRLGDPEYGNPYANKIYAPKDTEVKLSVSPKDDSNIMKLSKVELKKAGEETGTDKLNKETNKADEFVVAEKIVDDYVLTIEGTAGYQGVTLTDIESEENVIPQDKNYSIAPRKTYALSAYLAGGKNMTVGKLVVKDAGTEVNISAENNIITASNSDGVWTLNVKEGAGGKDLTVEIYADAKAESPIDTITLKVAPCLETVTVGGLTGGKIKQQIGTTVKYELTYDKASKDTLVATIDGSTSDDKNENNYATVKIEGNKLVVATKAEIKPDAAKIVIKSAGGSKELAAVMLETVAPAWTTGKPTLKQAGASDISLTLDITAPKGAEIPSEEDAEDYAEAKFWYKVTFKVKGSSDEPTSIYIPADGQVTRYSIKVSDKEPGKGEAKNYEVVAQLRLYKKGDEPEKDGTTPITESKESQKLSHATRNPYYADKITMKKQKAASALYTGQKDVHVATVDFGKKASYSSGIDVEIYDIPNGLSVKKYNGTYVDGGEGGVAVLSDDLKVVVCANKYAKPGKYTIKARTTYNKEADRMGSSIVQATASVQVTVVQSIIGIEASAPARILQKKNKAASAKIAVAYLGYYGKPKTPKMKYELVKLNYDDNGDDDDEYDNYEKITVNGITVDQKGNIKVAADFKPNIDDTDGNGNYCVRVQAADYPDNTTFDIVKFRVTDKPTELGKVTIVRYESGKYKELLTGEDIPINRLNYDRNDESYAMAVVVKPGMRPISGYYKVTDFVSPREYKVTAAKGISVSGIYSNGDDIEGLGYNISASKLGTGLTLKAVPLDGSDKTGVTSNKFNIVADERVDKADAGIVYRTAESGSFGKMDGEELNLDVAAGEMITLSVADKNANPAYPLAAELCRECDDNENDHKHSKYYDYTLTVNKKEAKVVKKYDGGLALDIIATKPSVEVTLKKGADEVGKYTIKVKNLETEATTKFKNATPKVSMKKGTKLYSTTADQELSFTMNKAVDGARYVRVSPQNNDENTVRLYNALSDKEAVLSVNNTEFSFEVKGLIGENKPIELKKGASFSFVFLDRDRNVLTKATNTVKIKTTALKKSFKLNAKYTMSTRDAFRVPFSGKGTGVKKVEYKKLYNANVAGHVNKFREGFKLTEDGLEIRVNEDGKAIAEADAEKWDWKKKTDFNGFVEYTVTYVDGSHEDFVSKITVNLKKTDNKKKIVPLAGKYKTSAVNVLNPGSTGTAEGITYVTAGKNPVDIRAAKVIGNENVSVKKVSGNAVTLEIKGNTSNKTYKNVKLYVLPLSGMYAYDNDYRDWADDVWQKKAVELKFNVGLKAKTGKGKIKNPAKSVSFLNVAPEKLAVDGKGKMYYYAELPYTVGTFAKMDTNISGTGGENLRSKNQTATNPKKQDKNNFEEIKRLIKVRKVSNKNAFGFYIDAEEFKEMVRDEKQDKPSWSGCTFSSIEMKVPFADNAAAETITFKLTLPNPWNETSASEIVLEKIIGAINGVGVKIPGIAYSSYDAASRTVSVVANDKDQKIGNAIESAKNSIAEEILKDGTVKRWIGKLDQLKVKTDLPGDGTGHQGGVGKLIKREADDTDETFLIKVVDAYKEALIKELSAKNVSEPKWNDILKLGECNSEKNETKIRLTITATPTEAAAQSGAKEKTEKCYVEFRVDENAIESAGDLDSAIARAVARMNVGPVITGITGKYDANSNKVTITGENSKLNFIDAKNQSRDKTVQILLSELGEYMDDIEMLTFYYEVKKGENDFIEVERGVTKDGRDQTSEQYIADLVDNWMDKLINKLMGPAYAYDGDGDPNVFGRLAGKSFEVEAKFAKNTEKNQTFTVEFVCDKLVSEMDEAVQSAVGKLSEAEIPGVASIGYDNSTKTVIIASNDGDQDIMDAKDAKRDDVVRILLNEMDEQISKVSKVTILHEVTDTEKDFIEVTKEESEATDRFISNLVDTGTQKLVNRLKKQNKETTYSSLYGETLEIEVTYSDQEKGTRNFTIKFEDANAQ